MWKWFHRSCVSIPLLVIRNQYETSQLKVDELLVTSHYKYIRWELPIVFKWVIDEFLSNFESDILPLSRGDFVWLAVCCNVSFNTEVFVQSYRICGLSNIPQQPQVINYDYVSDQCTYNLLFEIQLINVRFGHFCLQICLKPSPGNHGKRFYTGTKTTRITIPTNRFWMSWKRICTFVRWHFERHALEPASSRRKSASSSSLPAPSPTCTTSGLFQSTWLFTAE